MRRMKQWMKPHLRLPPPHLPQQPLLQSQT
jgi:hypothetical protein